MAAVKNKDSKAELALRRELHRRGLRYRLHPPDLPGRPDLVMPRYRLVVFVDGDFWHGNAWRLRELTRFEDQFPTNTEFWVAKIRRNMQRDAEVTAALRAAGWRVMRVWESEILADPIAAADQVERNAMVSDSAVMKSGRNPSSEQRGAPGRAAEQDQAAGGRERRRVQLGGGETALGSIELKQPWKPRGRIYAYLRYSHHGRTITKYVGNATATTREEALRLGWRIVHAKGLLDQRPVGDKAD